MNRRSADAARQDGDGAGAFHAADYMVYAQLQLGRDQADAAQVMDEFKSAEGAQGPHSSPVPYAAVAMPARLALERGDWAAAAQLQVQGTAFAHLSRPSPAFSRALGAARMGQCSRRRSRRPQRLEAQHKALLDAKNNYWATEVEVQRIAVGSLGCQGQGPERRRAAFDARCGGPWKTAARSTSSPPAGWRRRESCSPRCCSKLKQPAAALKESRQSQVREPNRFRNYLGSAKAAELAGDKAKAAGYYRKLVELGKEGDSDRPELADARRLASR